MKILKTKKGEKTEKIRLSETQYVYGYTNNDAKQPKFAIKYFSEKYNGLNIGSARKEDLRQTIKMIKNFNRCSPNELEFINRVKDSLNNPNTHSIIGLNDKQYEEILDFIMEHDI